MRLRDAGRLSLDDPLERHVPGTPAGDRTVGQLLSHTAGLTAESPGQWWERTPGGTLADLGLAPEHVPLGAGRQFHYSNLGYGLLGELLSALHGRSWDDVVRDEVLLPLGMTRTTPRPSGTAATGWGVHPWADVLHPEPEHHHGTMAPAGQLWATLADLARFAAFLLGDTGDVLDAATLEEMTVPAGVDLSGEPWSAYGLGLQVVRSGERTLVGHGGSMPGFLAGVFVDRAAGDGAVTLRNATSGGDGGLIGGLLDVLGSASRRSASPGRRPPRRSTSRAGSLVLGPVAVRAAAAARRPAAPRRPRPARAHQPVPRRGDGTWVGLEGYFAGEVHAGDAGPAGARDLRLHPHAVRPGAAGAGRGGGRRLALRCGDGGPDLRSEARPGG